MPLEIHPFVKDTVNPNGAVGMSFEKYDMMPDMIPTQTWLDGIVFPFEIVG